MESTEALKAKIKELVDTGNEKELELLLIAAHGILGR